MRITNLLLLSGTLIHCGIADGYCNYDHERPPARAINRKMSVAMSGEMMGKWMAEASARSGIPLSPELHRSGSGHMFDVPQVKRVTSPPRYMEDGRIKLARKKAAKKAAKEQEKLRRSQTAVAAQSGDSSEPTSPKRKRSIWKRMFRGKN